MQWSTLTPRFAGFLTGLIVVALVPSWLPGTVVSGQTSTPTPTLCPCSLWSDASVPTVASHNDHASVNLGVKFTSDVAGRVAAIRFYKGAANTGTHVGSLWTSTGTLLAQATFTSETATGWQQVFFSTPVPIAPNTTYVASYHAPVGGYARNLDYFATVGRDNAPLHAPASGGVGGNGVFLYGVTSAFPNQTFRSSNYWVDVVFTLPAGATPTPLPTAAAIATTTATPPNTSTPSSTSTAIAATPTSTATVSSSPTPTPTPGGSTGSATPGAPTATPSGNQIVASPSSFSVFPYTPPSFVVPIVWYPRRSPATRTPTPTPTPARPTPTAEPTWEPPVHPKDRVIGPRAAALEPSPIPNRAEQWLVVLEPVQAYSIQMEPLWMALPGEWYRLSMMEGGYALVVSEADPGVWPIWISADESKVRHVAVESREPLG